MATNGERVFVVLDAHDRKEVFEITRKVNDAVSLAQLLTPDLPTMLARSVREAAITRTAERVVRERTRRSDTNAFSGIWYISRIPPP